MMRLHGLIFVPLLFLYTVSLISGQKPKKNGPTSNCKEESCYPSTGDLMVGREDRLVSSSTCGLTRPERFCIVSHLEDQQTQCFVCDSRDPDNKKSHRVENIVSSTKRSWKNKWWQAENGVGNVSIQLDLEAEFHFTHIILKFKTFRPKAMLIERSYDFGKTWKVYRYFAHNCADSFPGIQTGAVKNIQTVICESKYSEVYPSTEGEVIFGVIPANLKIHDPYSQEVQDLLKITNLRLNFTKLHTLGDNLLTSGEEVKEKYYFSLYNMVVMGKCSCYGHASRCNPLPGQKDRADMVHGQCECTHFTKGANCEQCMDFYNELPWRPALGRKSNPCKKCDCNEHSTKCHFDAAVFGATNQVSGGVCDDCQHNTMGRHCEQCKPFFFHDPDRSITDPYACQSCDCDPIGSEQNGECESRTDPDIGAVAGRCKCKHHVHGKRCDTCKQGYWNLNNANPYGCEDCNCNPLGTVEGRECNMYTGKCECKRYVKGKHCDECIEGYWHLSSHPQGCLACDCDIGGSYNFSCSQYDGTCSCRPNIVGQQCKDSAVGYFVPGLDWLIYEGEHATPTGRANIEYRLAPPDIHRSWTGPGFMRVHEGSTLEFYVNDIPYSTHYDVVIRYEPQTNREWHDVKLSVIRTDQESLEGACANAVHGDTEASVEFQPTSRHWIVVPSSCLEKGKTYKIKLDFRSFRHDSASPDDSILIDSIVLMPSPDAHPVLQYSDPRNQREEYEHYRCDDAYLSPAYRAELYHLCRPIIFSMSSLIHDGAKPCDCDPVGSVNMECDPIGGQCRCKPYVVGRRCDQCQAGSFGFGPAGCVACQCDDLGSLDPTCDDYTGQCKCNPNVDGMRCDRCTRGFFSFPYCMQCRCNGLADECDEETGKCLYCRDNSGGDDCSRCADGYYGDPRPGHGGCKPCLCPGGAGSGMQYADTCRMETGIGQVVCDCHPGYSGLNCAECAMNYFGDPLRPGGTCTKCFCNNNIDHYVPHSCDSTTGQCLRCLYDTEGHQCERCRKGTFGDATVRDCQPCECNILGTNQTLIHDCDIYSGQCHCLPNVIGRKCDECAINHWKLASGVGCDACDCDKSGSRLDQCNLYDGQCDCIEGRGGRDCSQCPVLSWGDPTLGCKPCSCNPDGSVSPYCDKVTGQCECAKGVTGLNCDRCDRGTFGSLPHCTPCGECFDNWDRLINQLRDDAQSQLTTGTDIKLSGPPGAFAKEFEDLEMQLDEMKIHVQSADVSTDYLEGVDKAIDNLSSKLKALEPNVTSFDLKIEEETTKLTDLYSKLGEIQANHDKLNDETKVFKENAQKIQEQDISGASASIRDSYDKTSILHAKLTDAESVKSTSISFRSSAEHFLNQSSLSTESSDNGKENNLDEVVDLVNTINDNIQTINVELCGGTGSPCHEDCGGASCGKCGGELCDDGAVTKAWSAKNTSKKAEELLRSKQKSIASLYSTLKTSEKQCNQIISDATSLELAANATKNSSESQGFYVKEKIELGEEHLEKDMITAEDVENVVNQTLELTISLTPDEINKLSAEIQKTVEDLTDIDSILQATRNDIDNAEDLLHLAQRAFEEAVKVLNDTKKAKELLDVSAKGHDATEELLNEFATKKDELSQKIDLLQENLNDIQNNSNLDSDKVSDIVHRIEIVNSSFARNEKKLNIAESQSNRSKEDAMNIDEDILKFEEKYKELTELLKIKEGKLKEFKTRTDLVIKRVTFGDDVQSKTNSMKQMSQEYQQQQNSLKHYNTVVEELVNQSLKYMNDIKQKQSALLVCTG